jgi:hypothetical protein
MGQRLNLEIRFRGEVLANAYYHWSAYTGSSIELTEAALDAYYDVPEHFSAVGIAVHMLQATGAGIYPDEEERVEKDPSGLFSGISFRPAADRNRGLVSVTEKGIADTERWEEGRVTIHLDSQSVEFGVYSEYTKNEYEEYEELKFEDLELLSVNLYDEIPFGDFWELRSLYESFPDGFRTTNGDAVMWIQ